MPSPDATPYIDLRIYDRDPQDVIDAALLQLQTHLPLWVPREGNIEMLLLEALGLQASETVYAINRLPDGIMEALLGLFGVARDSGAPPVADLTFTVVNTIGYTISAGTEARLTLSGGLDPIVFTTTTDLVIAPGQTTGTVSATGDRFTDDANNIAANTPLEMLDSIIFIDAVELDTITTAGREPEDDTEYFTRGATRFSRLSDTLILPRHFSAYALENVDVERATTLDNWDGSGGVPGDDPGHVTIAVYGNGVMLSAPAKAALQAEMEALAAVNLQVHVVDPTITAVNVTAALKAKAGYDPTEVDTAVTAALNEYLDPQTWPWAGTVRRFELASVMDQVEGVDYVDTITTPASDTALTGNAPLADAGTINITVT
jgi:uncharacterized phage protein gp47/JayE